jgi:hypothetical protein
MGKYLNFHSYYSSIRGYILMNSKKIVAYTGLGALAFGGLLWLGSAYGNATQKTPAPVTAIQKKAEEIAGKAKDAVAAPAQKSKNVYHIPAGKLGPASITFGDQTTDLATYQLGLKTAKGKITPDALYEMQGGKLKLRGVAASRFTEQDKRVNSGSIDTYLLSGDQQITINVPTQNGKGITKTTWSFSPSYNQKATIDALADNTITAGEVKSLIDKKIFDENAAILVTYDVYGFNAKGQQVQSMKVPVIVKYVATSTTADVKYELPSGYEAAKSAQSEARKQADARKQTLARSAAHDHRRLEKVRQAEAYVARHQHSQEKIVIEQPNVEPARTRINAIISGVNVLASPGQQLVDTMRLFEQLRQYETKTLDNVEQHIRDAANYVSPSPSVRFHAPGR